MNATNLSRAINEAITESLRGVRVSVYQVGAEAFIAATSAPERGMLIGVWLNGRSVNP